MTSHPAHPAVASLTGYLHDRDLSGVVLAGHSIGGAYIAQAAAQAPTRIKRLVFLSAFVPGAGHALAGEFPPADAAFFDMTDPAQGFLLPFPVIRERACNDMDSAAATAIYAQMSPLPGTARWCGSSRTPTSCSRASVTPLPAPKRATSPHRRYRLLS